MIKTILTMVLVAIMTTHASSEEWIRILDPSSVRISISPTKKVVELETWKIRGHRNFINLSFWGSRGPIGRLYVDSIDHGWGKRTWPVFSLAPFVGEHTGGDITCGFAGSNVLVRNGKAVRQGRSFFARRNCPRTGIGVTDDGMIVVIVTTRSTLKNFARRFVENEVVFAINVDGGSSTMFVENGETKWNSKRSAVPVILSW